MGWERKEAQQTVEALFKYLTETLQEESQQLKNFIQLERRRCSCPQPGGDHRKLLPLGSIWLFTEMN